MSPLDPEFPDADAALAANNLKRKELEQWRKTAAPDCFKKMLESFGTQSYVECTERLGFPLNEEHVEALRQKKYTVIGFQGFDFRGELYTVRISWDGSERKIPFLTKQKF